VLLKIVYVLTCRVLGLAALVFRGDMAKDAELLKTWPIPPAQAEPAAGTHRQAAGPPRSTPDTGLT
jgi:hypothetical protein